jgi:hypothetical protein
LSLPRLVQRRARLLVAARARRCLSKARPDSGRVCAIRSARLGAPCSGVWTFCGSTSSRTSSKQGYGSAHCGGRKCLTPKAGCLAKGADLWRLSRTWDKRHALADHLVRASENILVNLSRRHAPARSAKSARTGGSRCGQMGGLPGSLLSNRRVGTEPKIRASND